MGSASLQTNGITTKLLFLLRDTSLADLNDPLCKVRKSRIIMFVIIELFGFGAAMAITQTIGMVFTLWNSMLNGLFGATSSGDWFPCCNHLIDPYKDVYHSTAPIYSR